MSRQFIRYICMMGILAWLGMGPGSSLPVAAEETASETETGVNVLTYGPIHEAFAEAVSLDPEPGIVIQKKPPDTIEEIPPDEKPEGDVAWIPGYWAWDEDRTDFIWVSGIWRAVPPNRQWIPGYWTQSQQGYQWISGYWAPEKQTVAEYLPEPPESVEAGPNISAPSADHTWIPGCWVWSYGRYAWRPGYWAPVRPDWMWVPAHYSWTPRGYIFVGGYWDFVVASRGVLFAPVAFGVDVIARPGFYFSPSFMIDVRVFSDCLFVWPRYHHYYFGDFYAPRFYHRGIYPWFSPHVRRHAYDPIYAHQRWRHRHDPHWERDLQRTYQARREFPDVRPPRVLFEPNKPPPQPMVSKGPGQPFREPFVPVTRTGPGMGPMKPLSPNERVQIQQRGNQVHHLSSQRLKLEAPGPGPAGPPTKMGPTQVNLPRSPITAGPPAGPAGPGGGQSKPMGPASQAKHMGAAPSPKMPPAVHKPPQPNPTVEPVQRRPSGGPGNPSVMQPTVTPLPAAPKGQPGTPGGPGPGQPAPPRPQAPQPNPMPHQPHSGFTGGGGGPGGPGPGMGNRPPPGR
jgi:hypothetical protein